MDTEYIRIAITFDDNSIGIMSFVTKSRDYELAPTDANIQQVINNNNFSKSVKSWRRIKESEIPSDRSYRNAWIDDGKIKHDMDKVRALHLDLLREQRDPVLKSLDVEWSIAMAKKDQTKADSVEAERQRLRDITTTVESDLKKAKTIEEVKQITIWQKQP
jgi:hypothetical protein